MVTKTTKYLLTINNPTDHGLTRELLIKKCEDLNPKYFCMSDEVGLEEKTEHTHIYIVFDNARSFNTIKKQFESAHIDDCYGTHQECIAYVFKEGKWSDDPKSDTNLKDTHYECGVRPESKQGQRNDILDVIRMVDEGFDNKQILEVHPKQAFNINKLDNYRNFIKIEENKNIFRTMDVTFICGTTGSGKTRYVMEKYGYENVYRTTDYKDPFFNYRYQDVVMFDEFHGSESISLNQMLMLLDGYPLNIHIRYGTTQACYTKVYIVTNLRFEDLYYNEQYSDPQSYQAFIRRINRLMIFDDNEKLVYLSYDLYTKDISVSLAEYEESEVLKNENNT